MKLAATHAIAAIARKPAALKKRTPSVADLASLVGAGGAAALAESALAASVDDISGGNGGAAAAGGGASEASSGSVTGSGSGSGRPPVPCGAGGAGSDVSCSTSAAAAHGNGVRHPSPARSRSPGFGRSGSPALPRPRKSLPPHHPDDPAAAAHTDHGAPAAPGEPAFGRSYIIPRPFDDRLAVEVAAAVVQAAVDTGVARITDIDMQEYRRGLTDLTLRMNL
ncbi:hypothetical protein MNEG_13369 [Monoraphidium neglectum]|uniref:Uncharacterized protein n=1 Tax=Monoraphidium neglectum TaxID=145388 RepID=A0A0D2LYV4_9CHLO|nr:hypothetical protein MNEG_13369 [Monoraphidium neglectum]KIY94591.1 hypothetical protein MNEG_13369 [Monoraphidium neglectum]|eukprot:XP_013893611.1 hypothetical protein MNEG_13369 [Monoraphidium neglectum]